MSSPLTLIILGQAYFVGTSLNSTAIDQPHIPNASTRADYTYTPGIGSHKVHTAVTTWIKALKICRDEGAHLAIINSRAEANLIARIVAAAGPHANSYSGDYAWIGTHDLVSQQGDYETIFGEPLAQAGFNEWHEAKSVEGPHCGAAFRDGELSWFDCARKLGFICESLNGQTHPTHNAAINTITQDAAYWIRHSLQKTLAES